MKTFMRLITVIGLLLILSIPVFVYSQEDHVFNIEATITDAKIVGEDLELHVALKVTQLQPEFSDFQGKSEIYEALLEVVNIYKSQNTVTQDDDHISVIPDLIMVKNFCSDKFVTIK
jgi:hypothetical protein